MKPTIINYYDHIRDTLSVNYTTVVVIWIKKNKTEKP